MHDDGKLIFCMLRRGDMWFMLNRRAESSPEKPAEYDGLRLYWTPKNITKTREKLKKLGFAVSDLEYRDYGQTEFFLTDDDGFSHCFGVPTKKIDRLD